MATRGATLRMVLSALLVAAGAASGPAYAEADGSHVAEMARVLGARSATVKQRISAVTAMARLADHRALKPLVAALDDASPTVRAIAATGLGKLGHPSALPALRQRAGEDDDPLVREQAEAAVRAITGAAAPAATGTPTAAARVGFGSAPRAVAARPDLYVIVKATNGDAGPRPARKKAAIDHAELARTVLLSELARTPTVTCAAVDAGKFGLDAQNVDLTVTRVEQRVANGFVEVEAHLRVAISDRDGRMKSFVSGGAKVQVPRHAFDPRYLPRIREEAVEGAVKGILDKLLLQLRRGIA